MPQYLKCLATVPCDLSLITISVTNRRLFSDINMSQGSVCMVGSSQGSVCMVGSLAITLMQIYRWV